MKLARIYPLLLAVTTALVVLLVPSSALAIGANDPLPRPTVTNLPAATNLSTATFTLSTTIPSNWFVDFGCSYDSAAMDSCDSVAYPNCTPAGAQKICTQTISRFLALGNHIFRFRAAYCDDPTIEECELNGDFYVSETETVRFVVERTPPVVTIFSGPKMGDPVLKAGARSYTFSANEASTFTCSFEGWSSPMTPCTSPFVVPAGLSNGSHRFVVWATDAAGNRGAATRGFSVDVFHPKKCAKGSSKRAKAKRKKCVKKNTARKKAWKKKHKLK